MIEVLRFAGSPIMTASALSLLQPNEVCTIFLTNGTTRQGKWNPLNRGFHLCDAKGVGFVSKDYVEEWIPESMRRRRSMFRHGG